MIINRGIGYSQVFTLVNIGFSASTTPTTDGTGLPAPNFLIVLMFAMIALRVVSNKREKA